MVFMLEMDSNIKQLCQYHGVNSGGKKNDPVT